jgi:hypothetical protein
MAVMAGRDDDKFSRQSPDEPPRDTALSRRRSSSYCTEFEATTVTEPRRRS